MQGASTNSLPVPDSPSIKTAADEGARRTIRSRICSVFGAFPIMSVGKFLITSRCKQGFDEQAYVDRGSAEWIATFDRG